MFLVRKFLELLIGTFWIGTHVRLTITIKNWLFEYDAITAVNRRHQRRLMCVSAKQRVHSEKRLRNYSATFATEFTLGLTWILMLDTYIFIIQSYPRIYLPTITANHNQSRKLLLLYIFQQILTEYVSSINLQIFANNLTSYTFHTIVGPKLSNCTCRKFISILINSNPNLNTLFNIMFFMLYILQ